MSPTAFSAPEVVDAKGRVLRRRKNAAELGCVDVPLGGVWHVELLTMPVTGRTVKKWMMRSVTPLTLGVERRPHPLEGQGMSAALTVRAELPFNVIVPAAPRVAFWDPITRSWREEPENTVKVEGRTLSFKTTRMSAMALVQSRASDLPYLRWALRPVPKTPLHPTSETLVRLEVQTPRFRVQFLISEDALTLEALEPAQPEVGFLLGQPTKPGVLLTHLARCGLRLLPVHEDADVPGLVHPRSGLPLTPRNAAFEDALYQQVAMASPAFAMKSSRWNQDNPEGEFGAVLCARESLDPDERDEDVHETDWRTVFAQADAEAVAGVRFLLVNTVESSPAFDATPTPGAETHNTLLRSVGPRSTREALQRAEDSSALLTRTVFRTLSLIKPLSFA